MLLGQSVKKTKQSFHASEEAIVSDEDKITAIPWKTWDKIIQWGETSGLLSEDERKGLLYRIRDNIKYNHPIQHVSLGIRTLQLVLEHNPDLLDFIEDEFSEL